MPINSAAADTAAKIEAIVNAYAVVLAQANDVDGTPGNNTTATTPNATTLYVDSNTGCRLYLWFGLNR